MQAMGRKHAKAAAMGVAISPERGVIQIATTTAHAQNATPPNTEQVPVMVLAGLGVAALLVNIGRALPQLHKALAQNVHHRNIQTPPMCGYVLRGMAAMLVNIGRMPPQQQKALAQHVLEENIQPLPTCCFVQHAQAVTQRKHPLEFAAAPKTRESVYAKQATPQMMPLLSFTGPNHVGHACRDITKHSRAMVLVQVGVIAVRVHIGSGHAQRRKVFAQHAPPENTRPPNPMMQRCANHARQRRVPILHKR